MRKKGTVSEKKVRFVFLSVHIIMNTHTRVQSPHARLHDYTNIRNVLEVKKKITGLWVGRGWGIVEKESVEERGCFESKIADSARMV